MVRGIVHVVVVVGAVDRVEVEDVEESFLLHCLNLKS